MKIRVFLILGIAAALPLMPVPDFWITQANYIGLYALVVLGLVLLTGVAGLMSFGQAAFVGIGAYATAYLSTQFGISPWLTLLIGLAVTGVSAFLIGFITLQMSGHYLPIATIAWSVALYYLFGSVEALGKYDGLAGLPSINFFGWDMGDARAMYALIWIVVGLSAWGLLNLLDSHPGRAIRALKGGAQMAEAMGVNTARLKIVIFVLAALLASVSGWLFAHLQRNINPTPFGLQASLEYVIMLVVGGMSHVWGAVLGAGLVKILQDQLQTVLPSIFGSAGSFEIAVFGVILILMLRFAPEGLWPWVAFSKSRKASRVPIKSQELPRRPVVEVGATLLQVSAVRKQFGGLMAVDSVDLEVRAGDIVGLIGPNGAGKSTTFNLITGLLEPTSGKVFFRDRRIDQLPSREIVRLGMARTFQHVKLIPDMSVIENVALGAYLRAHVDVSTAILRMDRAIEASIFQESARALHRVGLGDLLHMEAGSLALGQQRLLEIARALCADPVLLLLDEPAAGLRAFEKTALARLLAELRDEGMGILLVEHDMQFVMQLTDQIVVMVFGRKIAQGAPSAIQTNPDVLEAYLGVSE